MQLNVTTDYAIRIVLYLASTERITTSAEIADEMHIPGNYVPNIVKKLRDKGLVHATFGPRGGYRLAKDAKDISLLDILQIMEGTIRINRCLEDDEYCSRYAVKTCAVHNVYAQCQSSVESILGSKSVADILAEQNNKPLSHKK